MNKIITDTTFTTVSSIKSNLLCTHTNGRFIYSQFLFLKQELDNMANCEKFICNDCGETVEGYKLKEFLKQKGYE